MPQNAKLENELTEMSLGVKLRIYTYAGADNSAKAPDGPGSHRRVPECTRSARTHIQMQLCDNYMVFHASAWHLSIKRNSGASFRASQRINVG